MFKSLGEIFGIALKKKEIECVTSKLLGERRGREMKKATMENYVKKSKKLKVKIQGEFE